MKMSINEFISDRNPWLYGAKYKLPAFKRTTFFDLKEEIMSMKKSSCIVILGPRRVGKTITLLQLAQELSSEFGSDSVLYIPVDEAIELISNDFSLHKIIDFWRKIFGRGKFPRYIFLDEAQYAKDWSVIVKGIIDRANRYGEKVVIVATGSSEIGIKIGAGESLYGRLSIIRMFPLSLLECIGLMDDDPAYSEVAVQVRNDALSGLVYQKEDLLENGLDTIHNTLIKRNRRMEDALHVLASYGGLPEIVDLYKSGVSHDKIARRIRELVDIAILRDALRMQSLYELESVPAEDLSKIFRIISFQSPSTISINTLARQLGVNWRKVKQAITLLNYANLIKFAEPYAKDPLVMERKKLKKLFTADISFRNIVRDKLGPEIIADSDEMGKVAENLTLIHAQRISFLLGYPSSEIFFWRTKGGEYEVDVILKAKNTVAMEVKIQKTKKLRGLEKFKEYATNSVSYVISMEQEVVEKINGNVVLPLSYFLSIG